MRRWMSLAVLTLIVASIRVASAAPRADDGQRACASLVPDSVTAYAEVRGAGGLVRTFLESDLRRRAEASDAWKTFQSSPAFTQATMGLGFFQAVVGQSLWDALDVAASREAAAAIRPAAEGDAPAALLLLRGGDESASEKLLQGVLRLLAADGKFTATSESRGGATLVTAREKLHVARFGPTIAIASDLALLRDAADLAAKGKAGSLAEASSYRAALASATAGADGFAFVDLKRLAAKRPGGKLLPDAFENALGALLFADLAPALRDAAWVGASLVVRGDDATLDVRVPTKAGEPAAAAEAAAAIATPRVPRHLATLALSRDLSALWNVREKLLDANALSGLAQFNSFMGILFVGKQFGDDVLPEIGPDLVFVSARQEWPAGGPAPQTKFPAIALVMHLRNPKAFGPRLEVAFQTTIGVINADRGQKRQEPFSLRTEAVDGVDVTTARSLEAATGATLPASANASVSIALAGDRFVLSSSRGLCVDLVHAYQRGDLEPAVAGDRLVVRAAAGHDALRENEDALIANDMLTKGSSRVEATASIRAVLAIGGLFDSGEIARVAGAGTTGLRVRVKLRSGA